MAAAIERVLVMDSVFFSVEAEGGTAGVISNIFYGIRQQMKLKPMSYYCEAIDEIAIIPMCVSKETRAHFSTPERKYVGWIRRTADIRLYMDYEAFIEAPMDGKIELCKKVIVDSLDAIEERCRKRKVVFKKDLLLKDILGAYDNSFYGFE